MRGRITYGTNCKIREPKFAFLSGKAAFDGGARSIDVGLEIVILL